MYSSTIFADTIFSDYRIKLDKWTKIFVAQYQRIIVRIVSILERNNQEISRINRIHDDVIQSNPIPQYMCLARGIHRWSVDFP